MTVLMYLVRLSITELIGGRVPPAGPVNSVFTFTEISTAEPNSTVQVRAMVDPTDRTGLEMLLVTITVGGTMKIQSPLTLISL